MENLNPDTRDLIESKTAKLIKIIMKEMHMDKVSAFKLWYNSKTKQELWDKEEYAFVSISRCYDELLMELENHPRWLMGSFE